MLILLLSSLFTEVVTRRNVGMPRSVFSFSLFRETLALSMSFPEVARMDGDGELTNETPTLKLNAIEELKLKLAHRESETAEMIPDNNRGTATPPSTPLLSEEGLIIPRKPPNPVRENPERQNLHKELLFNQKIGKNVLNQKTELQKALEKHKENLLRKELENQVASTTPELEKVIADRARRLQEGTNENKNEEDKSINPEFLQARLKLRSKDAK